FKDDDAAALSSPATSETSLSASDQDVMAFQPSFYGETPTSHQMGSTFHGLPTEPPPFQHHSFGSVSTQDVMMSNSSSSSGSGGGSGGGFDPIPYLQLSDQSRKAPRSHPGNYHQPVPVSGDASSMLVNPTTMPLPPRSLPPSFSGQSPRLIDLLSPGTDIHARPVGSSMDYRSKLSDMLPCLQEEALPTPPEPMDEDADFDEEIVRLPPCLPPPPHPPHHQAVEQWALRLPSPAPSASSNSSGGSPPSAARPLSPFFCQPQLPINSPEMLMVRFDKQTCGILSIKDGPTENPWRTLVWPLARESPALYHAVSSMTAFHVSRERTSLRVDGMEHMRESIRALANGLENMRTDAALATTLALAFSESWDRHISTGIEHLRGAKVLIEQALVKHEERPLSGDDYARLKFLCNTFVYMDVIARLTSDDDDDESSNFDTFIPQYYGPFSEETEIDPLMGCAATLFPLIGCVANLARRIRKSDSTTVLMIEQGMELKAQIENWRPGTLFDPPEDPTSGVQHCIQTAEAYRWATLLYLHQALPEIPSPTTAQLANKVMVYLATVPLQSRTVIIHIFPLLVAGCEAVGSEREWVKNRWEAMIQRLCIGNVDKCWEVTKEVWDRRDRHQMEKARSQSPMNDAVVPRSKSNSPVPLVKRKYSQDEVEEIGRGGSPFHWRPDLRDSSCRKRTMSGDRGSPRSFTAEGKSKNMLVDASYVEEDMDYDLTVRGRLHWAGVMKEWDWEG
ncbi:hypothetical protein GP486_008179, partial [Trichoglossum hirsutum]